MKKGPKETFPVSSVDLPVSISKRTQFVPKMDDTFSIGVNYKKVKEDGKSKIIIDFVSYHNDKQDSCFCPMCTAIFSGLTKGVEDLDGEK